MHSNKISNYELCHVALSYAMSHYPILYCLDIFSPLLSPGCCAWAAIPRAHFTRLGEYLLPDRTPLEEKAVMYYPLYISHGIEARNDTTNEVIPYRKRGAIFDLIPRCLVIEFWTPKPKANFNQ